MQTMSGDSKASLPDTKVPVATATAAAPSTAAAPVSAAAASPTAVGVVPTRSAKDIELAAGDFDPVAVGLSAGFVLTNYSKLKG